MAAAVDEFCIFFRALRVSFFRRVCECFALANSSLVLFDFFFLFFFLDAVITNNISGQRAKPFPARILSPTNQAGVIMKGLSYR
jgi:hypothetical protein